MGKRNSQLQELTVVAQNDYLTIVDTSAGQSKRVSVKTLVGNVDLGWVATGESWTYSSWSSTTRVGVITVPSDATTKYTPGMRTRFSQTTGGTKYGIILAVTTTTLTVFFPSGTTFTNETITSPVYSNIKVPYGFDADPSIWKLSVSVTGGSQSAGSYGTYYNFASLNLVVPVGSWDLSFAVMAGQSNSTAALQASRIGLSTASNSASDEEFIAGHIVRSSSTSVSGIPTTRRKVVKNASQTTYYFVYNIEAGAGSVTFQLISGYGNHVVSAVCAYL